MTLDEWYEKNGFHYDGRSFLPGFYINPELGISIKYELRNAVLRVFGDDIRYKCDALWLADLKCPAVGDIPQETLDELNKFVVIRTLDK